MARVDVVAVVEEQMRRELEEMDRPAEELKTSRSWREVGGGVDCELREDKPRAELIKRWPRADGQDPTRRRSSAT